jgi:hypothetical protein
MVTETWKDIPGYEDYQVSDCGRVWSKKTNKILSLKLQKQKGRNVCYLIAALSINNIRKYFYVQRLVMLAFKGPMPKDVDVVMHLDDNPVNNHLSNLKYGTQKENVAECIRKHRHTFQKYPYKVSPTIFLNVPKLIEYGLSCRRPILAINKEGVVLEYDSLMTAARELKLPSGNICNVLKGRANTCKGFTFKYAV